MSVHRFPVSLFLVLVPAAALAACAPTVTGGDGKASQAEEAAGDDGGDEPPPDDGDPHEDGSCGDPSDLGTGTCEPFTIGDWTTCLSPSDIKSQALDACAASGRVLVDLSPAWDCADGGSSYSKGMCCDSGVPAGDPVPPDPGPDPAGGFGDGVTCVANSDYLAMAEAACADIGMTLLDFYTTNDCSADQSRYAKYICAAP